MARGRNRIEQRWQLTLQRFSLHAPVQRHNGRRLFFSLELIVAVNCPESLPNYFTERANRVKSPSKQEESFQRRQWEDDLEISSWKGISPICFKLSVFRWRPVTFRHFIVCRFVKYPAKKFHCIDHDRNIEDFTFEVFFCYILFNKNVLAGFHFSKYVEIIEIPRVFYPLRKDMSYRLFTKQRRNVLNWMTRKGRRHNDITNFNSRGCFET